jgi:hypothetical protein
MSYAQSLSLNVVINLAFATRKNNSETGSSGTIVLVLSQVPSFVFASEVGNVAFSYVYSGHSFGSFGPFGLVVTRRSLNYCPQPRRTLSSLAAG